MVQEGMDRLMEGRTVFVIAHRLSTIVNSDVIMVMDHGRIIERGDQTALWSKVVLTTDFIPVVLKLIKIKKLRQNLSFFASEEKVSFETFLAKTIDLRS